MKTLTTLFLALFLFTGIILLAENKPDTKERPVCPYMQKMEQKAKSGSAECPYSSKKEMKNKSGECPYSGKSLEKSKKETNLQDEIEFKRSKQLLDEKLKIVIT